jgi:ABC-type Mn2+/Zn2+ transport system ATPase subunit
MERLEKLSNHIIQAEGVCLEQFIYRVNTQMKWYMEQIFPDHSLQMVLDSEKECKNGKIRHEICVRLTQYNNPCELRSLSGGEYDRCALAFMLCINELSHSPCLFLDESISSLDMNLSEDVLEVIKDKFQKTKVVLLVSHQANTGFFDHVISL